MPSRGFVDIVCAVLQCVSEIVTIQMDYVISRKSLTRCSLLAMPNGRDARLGKNSGLGARHRALGLRLGSASTSYYVLTSKYEDDEGVHHLLMDAMGY